MTGPIRVMIAGLPGNMASLVATNLASSGGIQLCRYGLGLETMLWPEELKALQVVPPAEHIRAIVVERPDIIVDFTLPIAVNRNAEMYCETDVPFVIGTTGGDRKKLEEMVRASRVSAVISTNMAAPIVMFMGMMKWAAETFPNALAGYRLEIWESHQKGKTDTSGTAKTLVANFQQLGISFEENRIVMVRDPGIQETILGVPAEHLGGHGHHTYKLVSEDGTVRLQFVHDVNGRQVYADGVLKAIRFLYKKRAEKGQVFSMIDVLRG